MIQAPVKVDVAMSAEQQARDGPPISVLEADGNTLISHKGFCFTHRVLTKMKNTGRQYGISTPEGDALCKMLEAAYSA